MWREEGDGWHIAETLCQLGLLACAEGDATGARACLDEATGLRRDLLDQVGLAESLDAHAALAAAQGEPARALRLAGAARALRDTLGWSPRPSVQRETTEWLRPAREALGEAAAAAAWAEGRELSMEEAVACALAPPAAPEPGAAATAAAGRIRGEHPAALTRREREVAALIAAGSANRQIAEKLAIAETTAERHVANIFAKLGVHSRAQVAAWTAARPGV